MCEPRLKGFVYLYNKIKYRDEHLVANKITITVKQLIDAHVDGDLAIV
ncbi:MAG: hypothetical protein ACI89W_000243 [Gammaproteobacteria bacterium]|jgi:hypothetical protein